MQEIKFPYCVKMLHLMDPKQPKVCNFVTPHNVTVDIYLN